MSRRGHLVIDLGASSRHKNARNRRLAAGSQVLTEAVHPSVATLVQHLEFNDDHNIVGVNFGALHDPPPDLWIACAVSALSAAATIEAQREGQPRVPRILELAEKYEVPYELSAKKSD